MAGILDYQRYIELFYTVKDVQDHFPEQQLTVEYDFDDQGYDGWVGTISWQTLIVDKIIRAANNKPDFTSSQVLGTFPADSKAAIANGILQFPVDMYTGPILPDKQINVPVTVVSFTFTRDDDIFSQQFLLIENWLPGHKIGNPVNDSDYQPVNGLPSTLTLTADQDPILLDDDVVLTAASDIPLDLSTATNWVRFYHQNTGGSRTLVGTSTFSAGNLASVSVNTTEYGISSQRFYARYPGYINYGPITSNDVILDIIEGYPLSLDIFNTPDPTAIGVTELTTATARISGGYPSTSSQYITNNLTFTVSTGTSTLYTVNGNFENAYFAASYPITSSYIPSNIQDNTSWTVYGINNNIATTAIEKVYTANFAWQSLRPHLISSGHSGRNFVVTATTTYPLSFTPLELKIFDTSLNTTTNNAWVSTPLSFRSKINLGHELNNTVTDVSYVAEYSDVVDISPYVAPTVPSLQGTTSSAVVQMPRPLAANQIIITDKTSNVVGYTFTFPSAAALSDTSTYTVVSASVIPEGQLLTLNTNTLYSSYNQAFNNTSNPLIQSYLSETVIIPAYAPVDFIGGPLKIAKSIVQEKWYDSWGGSMYNMRHLNLTSSQTIQNYNVALKYLSSATFELVSYDQRSFVPDKSSFVAGNPTFRTDAYYRNYFETRNLYSYYRLSYSAGTHQEFSNKDSRSELVFTAPSFVNGTISFGTVAAYQYVSGQFVSTNNAYEIGDTNTIWYPSLSQELSVAGQRKGTVKSRFYTTDRYNVAANNGQLSGTMTNVLYLSSVDSLVSGSSFTYDNTVYTVVSVNTATSSVIVDPPIINRLNNYYALNNVALTFTTPTVSDRPNFSENSVVALKTVQQGVPYFTGQYIYDKVKFKNTPKLNSVFKLAGGTNSPDNLQFAVIGGPDLDGWFTIEPPYELKTYTGSEQWQQDNETYSYFVANELNRPLSVYVSPFNSVESQIINTKSTNVYILDYIPANLRVGASVLGVTGNQTVTAIDYFRDRITVSPGKANIYTDIGRKITYENVPITYSSTVNLGTATTLIVNTATNQYEWRLDRTLPVGSYNVTATIVNHLITGTNVTITYPTHSNVQAIQSTEAFRAPLILNVDTSNPNYDTVTITCNTGNSIDPNHFYEFPGVVTFTQDSPAVNTTAPWVRTPNTFVQTVTKQFAKGIIAYGLRMDWPGTLNYARTYDDQILFQAETLYYTLYSSNLIFTSVPTFEQATLNSNITLATRVITDNDLPNGNVVYSYSTGTYSTASGLYSIINPNGRFISSNDFQTLGTSTITVASNSTITVPGSKFLVPDGGFTGLQLQANYDGGLDNAADSTSTYMVIGPNLSGYGRYPTSWTNYGPLTVGPNSNPPQNRIYAFDGDFPYNFINDNTGVPKSTFTVNFDIVAPWIPITSNMNFRIQGWADNGIWFANFGLDPVRNQTRFTGSATLSVDYGYQGPSWTSFPPQYYPPMRVYFYILYGTSMTEEERNFLTANTDRPTFVKTSIRF